MYQALRLHIGQCAVQVLRKSVKKWVSNCSLKFWSQNFEKCGRARSHEKYNKWILCWLYIWVENVGSSFLPSWGMTILNWITPIWRVSLEASSLFVTIHPYFVLLLISFTSSSYNFSSFLSKQTFSHHLWPIHLLIFFCTLFSDYLSHPSFIYIYWTSSLYIPNLFLPLNCNK